LEERTRSAIVNVSSVTSYAPMPTACEYAASKKFISFFSTSLGAELKNTDVMIHAPGYVTTKLTNMRTGFDTITPEKSAYGALRDLGREYETNSCIIHEIVSWVVIYLNSVLSYERFGDLIFKA